MSSLLADIICSLNGPKGQLTAMVKAISTTAGRRTHTVLWRSSKAIFGEPRPRISATTKEQSGLMKNGLLVAVLWSVCKKDMVVLKIRSDIVYKTYDEHIRFFPLFGQKTLCKLPQCAQCIGKITFDKSDEKKICPLLATLGVRFMRRKWVPFCSSCRHSATLWTRAKKELKSL